MPCQHPFRTRTIHGLPVKVPCGSCLWCRRMKRTFWFHRVSHDVQSLYPVGSSFVTLTINSDIFTPKLHKADLQLFFKNLRKVAPSPFKYVAIGDYGDRTHRAHYHFLGIGLDTYNRPLIASCWSKGFIKVDPVTPGRIRYVINYMDKFGQQDAKYYENLGIEPPFKIFSRGIGSSLFEKYPHGRYFFRGRWYPYPSYHRAKHNASTPSLSLDETRVIISKAHSEGFESVPEYQNHRSWLSETVELHNLQNKLTPPQGIKHLPNSEPIC